MFERSVGKKPVPYIASSRTSTGGTHRRVAVRERAVEREAIERHRDERGVADEEAEARARETRARSISKRPTSVCSGPSGFGLPQRRSSSASSSVSPSGADGSGGFGTWASSASRSASAADELVLGVRNSSFTAPSSSQLLGRRLALEFCFAAQLVDLRHERAPALVGDEQRVERLGGALCGRAPRETRSGSARAAGGRSSA